MSNPYDQNPTNDPSSGGQDPTGQNPQSDASGQQWAQPDHGQGYTQPSAGDPYGQQAGNPYGQPSANDPYGQPTAADPYGQQAAYGQPAPYGQPVPYGQQGGYGYGQQPHPQGTTVLVLGIVGLAVCFIVGIFAVVKGNAALKEIDANPAAYNNRTQIVAGRICGIISIVLQGLGIILYGILIAVGVAAGLGSY